MTEVLKKCIECGEEFLTVFDKRCDQCQMKKGPSVWSHKKVGKLVSVE